MRTIGLVSATLNNYGSLLQTFALQKKVNESGNRTEIVKYKEPIYSKLKRMLYGEYLKVTVKKVLLNKMIVIRHKGMKDNLEIRNGAFEQFRKRYLKFSEACRNRRQLTSLSSHYRLVMLGSDQLWQPMNLLMDFFTLTFVPDAVPKEAYAASFGVSEIPKRMEPAYKAYLNRFDNISCREQSGADLVKKLTGRSVPVVCDPTLLMTAEEWMPVLSDKVKPNGKYIFCYFLGNNPQHRDFVKGLKRTCGYSIVALPHIVEYVDSDETYADSLPYGVGPSEFLYLLKNAEFVCTDSFHATVFSLQFHKQFFVFDRFENGKGRSTTSRIETLLNIAGCPQRLIRDTRKAAENLKAPEEITFREIDERLNRFREESAQYLKFIIDKALHEKKEC